jgi:hypothetical protein
MKTELIECKGKHIHASETKIGDLMILYYGSDHVGEILLRVYEGLVSLSNPRNTWVGVPYELLVTLLEPGDKVTLTQE